MACCADRRALLLGAAFVATLATAGAALFTFVDATALSSDASTRTAAAVAERWGVTPAQVHIEWTDPLPATATGELTLRGTGAQGHWVVDMQSPSGPLHRGRFRAGVMVQNPHAAYDLPRGAVITSADIRWTDAVAWGPPAREPQPDVAGWTTRRLVRAGEPLAPPAVAPPVWVRAGDDVKVVIVRGALELTLGGRAAGTGTAGERVAVRASTGRRITGTITAPGVVRVDAGKDL